MSGNGPHNAHRDRHPSWSARPDGDANGLRAELETTLRSTLHRRSDARAKLSHLADLRSRLDAAGLGFGDLAGKSVVITSENHKSK